MSNIFDIRAFDIRLLVRFESRFRAKFIPEGGLGMTMFGIATPKYVLNQYFSAACRLV